MSSPNATLFGGTVPPGRGCASVLLKRRNDRYQETANPNSCSSYERYKLFAISAFSPPRTPLYLTQLCILGVRPTVERANKSTPARTLIKNSAAVAATTRKRRSCRRGSFRRRSDRGPRPRRRSGIPFGVGFKPGKPRNNPHRDSRTRLYETIVCIYCNRRSTDWLLTDW